MRSIVDAIQARVTPVEVDRGSRRPRWLASTLALQAVAVGVALLAQGCIAEAGAAPMTDEPLAETSLSEEAEAETLSSAAREPATTASDAPLDAPDETPTAPAMHGLAGHFEAKVVPDRMALDVSFEEATATLSTGSEQIATVATLMNQHSAVQLQIAGHVDNRSQATKLALERANVVRKMLCARGVHGDRVETVGLGSTGPKIEAVIVAR